MRVLYAFRVFYDFRVLYDFRVFCELRVLYDFRVFCDMRKWYDFRVFCHMGVLYYIWLVWVLYGDIYIYIYIINIFFFINLLTEGCRKRGFFGVTTQTKKGVII